MEEMEGVSIIRERRVREGNAVLSELYYSRFFRGTLQPFRFYLQGTYFVLSIRIKWAEPFPGRQGLCSIPVSMTSKAETVADRYTTPSAEKTPYFFPCNYHAIVRALLYVVRVQSRTNPSLGAERTVVTTPHWAHW